MKTSRILTGISIVALTLVSMLSGPIDAKAGASLEGAWEWTFFIDPNNTQGATQTMCFYSDGTWYSPTWHWTGLWYQKKKNFKIFGDLVPNSEAVAANGKVKKKKLKKVTCQNWIIPAISSGSFLTGKAKAVRVDPIVCPVSISSASPEEYEPGTLGIIGE